MNDALWPVLWRRSTRARRLSLKIDPANRRVVVTFPHRMSQRRAEAFLEENRNWLLEKLAALPAGPALTPDARLLFNGSDIGLTHAPDQRQPARLIGNTLMIGGAVEHFERRTLCFFRQQAGLSLPGQLLPLATLMDCTPSAVACSNAKTRWGSCTRQGRIMLNWRLIMMPVAVRRYIMVHELAHLTHFDHSPKFWAHVERYHPQRQEAQAWLKTHGTPLLALG